MRNFESQLLDIIPLLNLNDITTFEDYCINLLLIEKENTDQEENKKVKTLPKKQYTSFQDIFVSSLAYNIAIKWLTENNIFINNMFVLKPKLFPEFFRALELKGYITTNLTSREKSKISKLIHAKGYGKSQFSDQTTKQLDKTIEETKSSRFYLLRKYSLKSDKNI